MTLLQGQFAVSDRITMAKLFSFLIILYQAVEAHPVVAIKGHGGDSSGDQVSCACSNDSRTVYHLCSMLVHLVQDA